MSDVIGPLDCPYDPDSDTFTKIVLNGYYGGLFFEDDVLETLGIPLDIPQDSIKFRTDPMIVKFVENLKKSCDSDSDESKERPDGLRDAYVEIVSKKAIRAGAVTIKEYDGLERIKINKEKIKIYESKQLSTETYAELQKLPESDSKSESIRVFLVLVRVLYRGDNEFLESFGM